MLDSLPVEARLAIGAVGVLAGAAGMYTGYRKNKTDKRWGAVFMALSGLVGATAGKVTYDAKLARDCAENVQQYLRVNSVANAYESINPFSVFTKTGQSCCEFRMNKVGVQMLADQAKGSQEYPISFVENFQPICFVEETANGRQISFRSFGNSENLTQGSAGDKLGFMSQTVAALAGLFNSAANECKENARQLFRVSSIDDVITSIEVNSADGEGKKCCKIDLTDEGVLLLKEYEKKDNLFPKEFADKFKPICFVEKIKTESKTTYVSFKD